MKVKKFNIDDYKGKYVMHCKTKEEARDFIRKHLPALWHEGSCCWTSYKSDTVYFFNRKTYQNILYAEKEGYTILEWSDFMNKEFTKADLKTGDVILRRNGTVEIVNRELGTFICDNGGWSDFDDIKEDLTSGLKHDEWDIIEVRRPQNKCDCCFNVMNSKCGTLIYKRKEPEEMTLAEVCKLLGKEIKIIKG